MKSGLSLSDVDRVFRAFSDPTRLRILNMLVVGEICVCDLTEVLGVPQPTVSRHLATLRKAGLVTARKEGYWSYYELASTVGALHSKLLESLASCSREVPELAADLKTLRRLQGQSICQS